MATVKEYAQIHNVPLRTVYNWIKEGKIKAEKKDGKFAIDIATPLPNGNSTQIELFLRQELEKKDAEVAYLRQELSQAQQRHDEVQQQSNMIIMQLTKQLEGQQLMLEDMRHRSLWKRFKTALGFSG